MGTFHFCVQKEGGLNIYSRSYLALTDVTMMLALVLVALIAPTYLHAMECPQDGVEVVGTSLETDSYDTPSKCADECFANLNCAAWSYDNSLDRGNCFLFLSVAGFNQNSNICSGDYDCKGEAVTNDACGF